MSPAVRKDLSFTQIPEWVLFHDELSAQAVRLYGVLARYADKEGQSHYSRAKLAEAINVRSVDTVDRAVKELVEHSALTVEERFDEAGDRTSNQYTVHVAPPEGVAARMRPPTTTDAATGGRTNAATVAAQNLEELEPFEVTPIAPTRSSLLDGFPPHPSGVPRTFGEPCAKHKPTGDWGDNCRACTTSPRQMERLRQRHTELAAVERRKAEAAARLTAPPPDPVPPEKRKAVRQAVARVGR